MYCRIQKFGREIFGEFGKKSIHQIFLFNFSQVNRKSAVWQKHSPNILCQILICQVEFPKFYHVTNHVVPIVDFKQCFIKDWTN